MDLNLTEILPLTIWDSILRQLSLNKTRGLRQSSFLLADSVLSNARFLPKVLDFLTGLNDKEKELALIYLLEMIIPHMTRGAKVLGIERDGKTYLVCPSFTTNGGSVKSLPNYVLKDGYYFSFKYMQLPYFKELFESGEYDRANVIFGGVIKTLTDNFDAMKADNFEWSITGLVELKIVNSHEGPNTDDSGVDYFRDTAILLDGNRCNLEKIHPSDIPSNDLWQQNYTVTKAANITIADIIMAVKQIRGNKNEDYYEMIARVIVRPKKVGKDSYKIAAMLEMNYGGSA